jgi:hypothetical protein
MTTWQNYLLIAYAIFSFTGFLKGLDESKNKKNAYGMDGIFNLNGAFVWADEVVFGLFWTAASLVTLFLNDWILFLLLQSAFWLIRSIGETIYWFLQQFSTINRNPPEKFLIYKIFKNDSVWFVFQIGWQCLTVISLIATIYLSHLWLLSF